MYFLTLFKCKVPNQVGHLGMSESQATWWGFNPERKLSWPIRITGKPSSAFEKIGAIRFSALRRHDPYHILMML